MSTSEISSPAYDRDQVAELLEDMADLLDIAGENEFKLRAYRNGAEVLRELSSPEFVRRLDEGTLDALEGIGDALSDKIEQAAASGTIDKFEETKTEFPVSLLDILDIHGIGPKSVRTMYDELGIENLTELESALQTETLSQLDGFGPKTVDNIRESLDRLKRFSDRVLLMDALPVAEDVVSYLESNANPDRIEVAGSYRRGNETVGDIDILVSMSESGSCGDVLSDHPAVEDVLAHGDTKTSVLMDSGIQVDLREVKAASFGAALLYFTGAKAHNVALRGRARDRGWTINEYGMFDEESGEKLAGETEQSIYGALDLNWIPPELREGHGEVKRAESETFDDLVEVGDVRGDCHLHTTASDGRDSLRAMADAARELGREYIVFTEHSQSLGVANGLEPGRLRDQVDRIRELNEQFDDIDLYAGTESDILENGNLDYCDDVLADLDLVIAAVHSKFSLPADQQTERIIKALNHPEVDVLAHPTGRKLGQRDPYEVRMEPVLEAAAGNNVAVEINSNGRRLDANPRWCRRGKELGVNFVINTDAHSTEHLWFTRLGIKTARRGGLTENDVLNTGDFEELLDCK